MNNTIEVFCETEGNFGMLLKMARNDAFPFAVAFLQAENAKQITIDGKQEFFKSSQSDMEFLMLQCFETMRNQNSTYGKMGRPPK
jgi:hypothetical protein